MAEHVAEVKLTLENAQFIGVIRDTGNQVDKLGKRGKKSLELFSAGADAARRSMGELGGSVKNTLKLAATFGGAFSFGAAIKDAVKLQSTYTRLAFGIRSANGGFMRAADVQQIVERAAVKTGKSNEELAKTFESLLDATGELDFSTDMLEALGHASMATGVELDSLVTLADQLHTKFGVTSDDMGDTIARMYQLTKFKGGPKFEELADFASTMGAELLAAGLDGRRGIDFMVGALKATDDPMKNIQAQVKGLRMLLRGLGNKGDLKELAKGLGIESKSLINEKDAVARLRKVLGFGKKGVAALAGSMKEGEEKQAMDVLFLDPFREAMKEAEGAGLKGKAAIDKALQTFDRQILNFGKATLDGADMMRQADEMRKTPEAQLNAALNKLATAMAQPEIIENVNELAKHLPKLAQIFGDLVAFAAKNPILAGTLGIGANAGASFVQGMAEEVVKAHIFGGREGGKRGGKAQAEEVVKGLTLTGALGESMTIPIREGLRAGGAGLKNEIFTAFTTGAGALEAAGKAFGIAASAYLAYKIGAEAIDNKYAEETDSMKRLENANRMGAPKTAKERDDQIKELETASKLSEDVGTGFWNNMARGGARTAALLTPGESWRDVPDSRVNAQGQREEARKRIEELRGTRFGGTTEVQHVGREGGGGKATVAIDKSSSDAMAIAMATALGGTVLDVRIRNLGPASAGPGGSRGPIAVPPARQGGGV